MIGNSFTNIRGSCKIPFGLQSEFCNSLIKYLWVYLFTTLFSFGIHGETHPNCQTKFLLITGCGRSGTTFMTQFLKASGLEIKHERLGRDGCVAWPMCGNHYIPWGKPASPVKFEHIFHQVRHPLDVITSWHTNGFQCPSQDIQDLVWEFIHQHIPEIQLEDDFLTQCAKYWYYWNLKAEQMAEWRYRIEDLEDVLPELEERLNISLKPEILHSLSKKTNTWLKIEHRLTWSELEAALPYGLFFDIQEMALRYGYSIID